MQSERAKAREPPVAQGTMLPSIAPIEGGPPHAVYPFAESEAVIPQRLDW